MLWFLVVMATALHPAVASLLSFAKPGASLSDRSDRRDVQRLSEVSKAFLQGKVHDLISAHANDKPLVRSYSSDGTPILLNRAWTRMLGSRVIHRHGKASQEYMVERTFYRGANAEGEELTAVVFRDPFALSDGKTGWHLMACQLEASPSLRALGFHGPAINHYVWDRGCYSVLNRLVRKWHQKENADNNRVTANLEALLNFTVTRADVLHDIANAFAWGMKPFSSSDVMKDIFVGISSIRNAYNIIMEHVVSWLPSVLIFVVETESPEVLTELWQSLGLEDDIICLLVRYRLLWFDGALIVSADFQDDPELINELVAVLMAVWRFVFFTESRYLTIGASARTVISALLTGIGSLIGYCRSVKHCSEYYIHGFDRLGRSVRSVLTIAALGSGPAESLLDELMADDRVMRHLEHLEETVSTEMAALHNLSDRFFELVSSVTDCTPVELRSKVVCTATSSASFIDFKIFAETRRYPFCLCKGDMSLNLATLAAGVRPTHESVADQMWQLLQFDYPASALIEVLQSISDLPWSSMAVEQAHAGAAVVMRYHPDLHEDSMMCRSMLYQMRALVTSDENSRRIARLQLSIGRIRHARPRHAGGRQLFLKEAMDAARGILPFGQGLSMDARKLIMQTHSAQYFSLDAGRRAVYEERAREIGERAAEQLLDDVLDLETQIDLIGARSKVDARMANPWRMTACTLSQADKDHFEALCASPRFSRTNVDALRRKAALPPAPVDYRVRLELVQFPLHQLPEVLSPRWVAEVCVHREYFGLHAFVLRSDVPVGDVQYFAFMFAYQSPYLLSLAKLERRDYASSIAENGGFGMEALASHWDYEFNFVGPFLHSTLDVFDWDEDRIEVLPGLVFLHGKGVASHSTPVPLRVFLDSLPQPRKGIAASVAVARPGGRSASATLVAENSWVMAYMDDGNRILNKHGGGEHRQQEALSDHEEDQEEDPFADAEVIAEVFEVMANAASEAKADHMGSFCVAPLGGQWTSANLGVAMDAWQGKACGKDPAYWCKLYCMQATMRFDLSLYGNQGALACARYFVQKMCFLYRLWVDGGAEIPFTYSDELLGLFQEPVEFTQLVLSCENHKAQQRFLLLRSLRPLGVGGSENTFVSAKLSSGSLHEHSQYDFHHDSSPLQRKDKDFLSIYVPCHSNGDNIRIVSNSLFFRCGGSEL